MMDSWKRFHVGCIMRRENKHGFLVDDFTLDEALRVQIEAHKRCTAARNERESLAKQLAAAEISYRQARDDADLADDLLCKVNRRGGADLVEAAE